MKQFILILISLALFSCKQVKGQNTLSIDVSKDIASPKHYIITKTTNAISIDGNADETRQKSRRRRKIKASHL